MSRIAIFIVLLVTTGCAGLGPPYSIRPPGDAAPAAGWRDDIQAYQRDLTALLEYSGTNLLALPPEDRSKVDWIADRVRRQAYSPLFVCQAVNNSGVTNIVYVEANYPWAMPDDRRLRFSTMRWDSDYSTSSEFDIGGRMTPYKLDVERDGNRDLLIIHVVIGFKNNPFLITFELMPHSSLMGLSKPRFLRAVQEDGTDMTELWRSQQLIRERP